MVAVVVVVETTSTADGGTTVAAVDVDVEASAGVAAVSSGELGAEAIVTIATPTTPITQKRLAMDSILAARRPGLAASLDVQIGRAFRPY